MVDNITCGQCGTHLEVDPNENSQNRKPCPNCGSTKRIISASIKETLKVSDNLKATVTKK